MLRERLFVKALTNPKQPRRLRLREFHFSVKLSKSEGGENQNIPLAAVRVASDFATAISRCRSQTEALK